MRWKQVVYNLVSIYCDSPQLAIQKSKLYKTLDYWSRDILNFNFSEKGLGLVSPPHFVYDFSRKMFLMLHSINWPNFIVWLLLLLEILGNMCITIFCLPGCDHFATLPKKSRQKVKHLENEKSFWREIENIFHHF